MDEISKELERLQREIRILKWLVITAYVVILAVFVVIA